MRFRTIDKSLAWMDQIFEDKLREFQTALLIDIPTRGVDVDLDVQAELIEEQRREWSMQREQIQRELIEWLANAR